jgi:hypothetical protein
MLSSSIRTELRRLNLHPVNLDVVSEIDGSVLLSGSLLAMEPREWAPSVVKLVIAAC